MLASGIANNDRVLSRLLARERPETAVMTIEREDYRRYLSTTSDLSLTRRQGRSLDCETENDADGQSPAFCASLVREHGDPDPVGK
jgi:hypothetical protein